MKDKAPTKRATWRVGIYGGCLVYDYPAFLFSVMKRLLSRRTAHTVKKLNV